MRGDHKDSERTDRHSSRVASAASPVQKSPNTPKKAHFSQFCTSRENFVPHQQPNRYKTLPVQPIHRPNRYKTLPTHPASSPTGTKLSPHTQKGPFQPVLPEQGELCTASTPMPPSWENFVPLPSPRPPAGRTLYRTPSQSRYKTLPAQPVQALTRYKTLPAHPHQQPTRYKTLPTHPQRPISARFARAGRTLYRSHPHAPQQGELCTALTITMPSRENFVPRPAPNPVQNSPNTHRPTSLPRISSPSTPKNGVFRLFCACWASFVAHKQPTGHAGRVFSRSMVRTDSPGGSFHWDRLLEPMSVAHGCDNGETTAGGASLRCLLRRVGAWPGSTRTIQTRPIGGCHVADRAWQQHPSAVAGPGPASRRRTKPTSKPRDGPRSDRAWLRRPWVPEGPGRASRSTTPSRQARVWRSRGQATAHRCHPRAHQAARPHSRIQQHLEHQLHPEHQRPTTTTHRHRPQMPPTGASSSPAPQTRATRHAPPDTRHQTRATRHAPGTPAGPQPQTRQSGPEPLGSGPPSILSDYRRHAPGGATRQVVPRAR